VAVLTALISVNGAVAALLPVVIVTGIRLKQHQSQLLMPLVFAAHAGSMLALTGTPVNVLVSDAAVEAGAGPFGYFEFALVGLPLLVGSIAIVLLVGRFLLPNRSGESLPADLSRHARTLVEQYGMSGDVFRLQVRPGSPLVARAAADVDFRSLAGLALRAMTRDGRPVELAPAVFQGGDVLIVQGEAGDAARLASEHDLALIPGDEVEPDIAEVLVNRNSGLAEVVIPPRSPLIGTSMFPGMATPSGDLIVLSVRRGGEDLRPGQSSLESGDSLLLQGTWSALEKRIRSPEVLVVNSPDIVRRQAVPLGAGAAGAIVVLLVTVGLLATGIVPPAIAGLCGAIALVLVGILSVEQAYRAINCTTVILVGAMMPLSTAMMKSGAADLVAEKVSALASGGGIVALIAVFFLVTALFSQLISNTATALIIIPIGIATAAEMGYSAKPLLMAIGIAAAAAFLTPVATPVNLMVMGPGGYKFGDYWKLGIVLMLWYFVIATLLVPLVWRP
jgi:di/tricarboxylate transporter